MDKPKLSEELEKMLDSIFMPARARLDEIEKQCPECEFKAECKSMEKIKIPATPIGDAMFEVMDKQTQTAVMALGCSEKYMNPAKEFILVLDTVSQSYKEIEKMIGKKIDVEFAINCILSNITTINDSAFDITITRRK